MLALLRLRRWPWQLAGRWPWQLAGRWPWQLAGRWPWQLAVVMAVGLVVACSAGSDSPEPETLPAAPSAEPAAAIQPDDRVNLTVYFRSGSGQEAMLVAVVKDVAMSQDLPQQALALLLQGPTAADGPGLRAPLPTTTRVLDFRLRGHTAAVDLSREVIADAPTVDGSPEHEILALAALANTLTEFPAIDDVRLTVEGITSGVLDGLDVGRFWGGWGLPAVLVRDDSVVAPVADGGGVADLGRFLATPQTIGTADAAPVQVTGVRVRQRTTYLRVTVELADAADPSLAAEVPLVRASRRAGEVVLEVDGVAGYVADVGLGQRLQIADPAFSSVTVAPADLPGTVTLSVEPHAPTDFYLHSLTSPTRIVLDLRNTT